MVIVVFVLVCVQFVGVEDIDLYMGLQQNVGKFNVVIVFDDGVNFDVNVLFMCFVIGLMVVNLSKSLGVEQCVLYGVVQLIVNNFLLLGNVNFGLMMFDLKSLGGLFRFLMVNLKLLQILQLMDSMGVNSLLLYLQNQFFGDLNGNNVQIFGVM